MDISRQIAERIAALRAEHDSGQRVLAELEGRRREVTETLLRIEGALQVLQELAAIPAAPQT